MNESTFKMRIKFDRDKEENWRSLNPVLLNGELVISDTPTGINIKIGNGFTSYNNLPFLLSDDRINPCELLNGLPPEKIAYEYCSKRFEQEYPILNLDIGNLVFRSEIPNTDFDKIYPVGSIYASTLDTDPYFLFHTGSWEYINKQTLYPQGSIYGLDIYLWRRTY